MPTEHCYHQHMLEAVDLASAMRFQTRPNPCVGALLVKDGVVVASGAHMGSGLPHAEVEALADARSKGIDPAECTMVVTLEPCRHYGKTPPCTEAILKAGVRHVVIGASDPNPEASGGADVLRAAGVRVEQGVALEACRDLIADFLCWKTRQLPYVLLKLASTLDGRIATRTGASKWITSEAARQEVHTLRGRVQAVMVGGGTFTKDNPQLTCRQEEGQADQYRDSNARSGRNAQGVRYKRDEQATHEAGNARNAQNPQDKRTEREEQNEQPLAVVVSSHLPDADLPMYLLRERADSLVFLTSEQAAASDTAKKLQEKGVRILPLPQSGMGQNADAGRPLLDIASGLTQLYREYGCHYILCEGGGRLALSLLQDNLVGELHLHLAPKILADNEAAPLFTGLTPLEITDALQLRITGMRMAGPDVLLTLKR